MSASVPARGTTVIRPRIAYFWWLEAHRSSSRPTPPHATAKATADRGISG